MEYMGELKLKAIIDTVLIWVWIQFEINNNL